MMEALPRTHSEQTMTINASTTATTATVHITAPDNVHYILPAATGLQYQVVPHTPTAR